MCADSLGRVSEASIRSATLADVEALSVLHVRAWQSAYRGLLPEDLLDGISLEEWTRRRRRGMEQPASPLTRTWVRETLSSAGEPRLIGFAIAGPCRDSDLHRREVGEVYAMYLEPAAVGLGHGRALMQHTLRVLEEQGFREVSLWVLEQNARARRFYDLAGFQVDPGAPPRTLTIQGRALDTPEVRLRRRLP